MPQADSWPREGRTESRSYTPTLSRAPMKRRLRSWRKEFIHRNEIQFLFGSYGQAGNSAVAKTANKKKIPFITSTATESSLFDQGLEYVFGIMTLPNGALSGAVAALRRYLSTLIRGPSRFCLPTTLRSCGREGHT